MIGLLSPPAPQSINILRLLSRCAELLHAQVPQVPMDRVQYLERMAIQYLSEAEQEERDKSPVYFAPNISVYTR